MTNTNVPDIVKLRLARDDAKSNKEKQDALYDTARNELRPEEEIAVLAFHAVQAHRVFIKADNAYMAFLNATLDFHQ